jgi:hypothetical protein
VLALESLLRDLELGLQLTSENPEHSHAIYEDALEIR